MPKDAPISSVVIARTAANYRTAILWTSLFFLSNHIVVRQLTYSPALDAFESRKTDLKGDGKSGRWFSPLELHVLPKLGKMPVSEIDLRDIRDALAPIWHSKASTAQKAMDRIGICIRHAAALGLDVDIQATDKAKALLADQLRSLFP